MRRYFMMTAALTVLTPLAAGAAPLSYPVTDNTQHGVVQVVSGEQAGKGARDFIDKMGKQAISFLGNEVYSQTQKEQEFRTLLKSSFDMKTIGRFALGRYWASATPAQQKEYLNLFEDMVVDVYAARFTEYKGQALDVASFRPNGEKDTLVTSYIVDPNGSGKFQVDWRVRNKGGTYKIVDVIIEGVSMSLTQRSDFSSVIQRGGGDIQALLDHLRGRN